MAAGTSQKAGARQAAKGRSGSPRRRKAPAAKHALPRVPGRYRTTKKGEQIARLVAAFLAGFIRHPDRGFAGKPFVPEALAARQHPPAHIRLRRPARRAQVPRGCAGAAA